MWIGGEHAFIEDPFLFVDCLEPRLDDMQLFLCLAFWPLRFPVLKSVMLKITPGEELFY